MTLAAAFAAGVIVGWYWRVIVRRFARLLRESDR
jgi:hypothetical protein